MSSPRSALVLALVMLASTLGVPAVAGFGVPPAEVQGLRVEPPSRVGELTLTWGEPVSGTPDLYRVYAGEGPVGPVDDAAKPARLLGGERVVLQMDADDHDAPAPGSTRDASGFARDGALQGVSQVAGRHGDAYEFAGADQYIGIASFGAMSTGTVSAWVRVDSHDPSLSRVFVKQRPGVANYLTLLVSDRVEFGHHQATSPLRSPAGSVPLGTWTHVAATWDASGKRVYIDGVLAASSAAATSVLSGYTHSWIGNSPAGVASGGFDGAIDEFREYGRALSAAELWDLARFPYNAPEPVLVPVATTSATTFTHAGLQPDAPWNYRVVAVNAHGEGAWDRIARERVLDIPLEAPASLIVTPGEGALTIAWEPPLSTPDPVTSYRIHRAAPGGAFTTLADVGSGTLSYLDTGLGVNETWRYRVSAWNASGEGPLSIERGAPTFGPPRAPPSGVVVTRGGAGELVVSWGAPADDGGVAVTAYRVLDDAGDLLADTPVASWTHAGLPPNATRAYRVLAVNAHGAGPISALASATTFDVPREVRALAGVPGPQVGEVTLSWSAPVENGLPVTGYEVSVGGALLAQTTAETFVMSGLAPGESRTYDVVARNDAGASAPTSIVAAAWDVPSAPLGLAASTGPGRGNVTLAWSAPASDGGRAVAEYRVYAGGSEETLVPIAITTVGAYKETDLGDGETRVYRVAAANEVGEGAFATAQGASPALPQPPANLTAAHASAYSRTRLTWDPPADAAAMGVTGYRVYRGAPGGESFLDEVVQGTSWHDHTCPLATTCSYRVSTLGAAGESARSSAVSLMGTAWGVASTGRASGNSAEDARLAGREVLVLQMDRDDRDVPLNGYTRDSSTRGNHAQAYRVLATPGRFGDAYFFSDTGRYLSVLDSASGATPAGTLMMWANLTSVTPTHGTLAHKAWSSGGAGSNDELKVKIEPDGRVTFRTSTPESQLLSSAPGTFVASKWTHVAVTWGPDGKRIVVDGKIVAHDQDTSAVSAFSSITQFGVDVTKQSLTGLHGKLDEIRWYDVTLPLSTVQSLMTQPYARPIV